MQTSNQLESILNAPEFQTNRSNFFNSYEEKDPKTKQRIQDEYLKNMNRKAKTHKAKAYRFLVPKGDGEKIVQNQDLQSTEEPQPTKQVKKPKQVITSKEKTLADVFWKKINPKVTKIAQSPTLEAFKKIQIEILEGLKGKEDVIFDLCPKEIKQTLQSIEQKFASKSSFSTGNEQLFEKLGLTMTENTNTTNTNSTTSTTKKAKEFQYYEQIEQIQNPDRCLNILSDSRCIGFKPTQLQRTIMDHIDANKNVIVRSPSSTGKTMLSLYLCQSMIQKRMATVYLAPNKPLCNEFSLFVYNMDMKFAICTEDFFEWDQVNQADVIICTPPIFFKLLVLSQKSDYFAKKIGAAIFDELPDSLKIHSEIPLLLSFASSFQWQCFVISATLSNDLRDTLQSIMPFAFLEPSGSIRPTDIVLVRYDDTTNKSKPTLTRSPTSSLYSQWFLSQPQEVRSTTALRLPISMGEFKNLAKDLVENEKSTFQEIAKQTLPSNRVLHAIEMTNFTVSASVNSYELKKSKNGQNGSHSKTGKQEISSESSNSDSDSEQHSQSNSATATTTEEEVNKKHFVKKTATALEIYTLLKQLAANNALPAMLFHSDRDLLNQYHSEISEILIKQEEDANLEAAKQGKEKTTQHKDDFVPGEEVGAKSRVNMFGFMGDDELAEIFKHRADRSGSESQNKIKFGKRGQRVLKSEFYPGVRLGLGIHHHDIDAALRDAVESGLRLGNLRVVLCDHSMALGLNMPVKTVVFLGGNKQTLDPEDFVQASGRAGRWGQDVDGGRVIFYGLSWNQVSRIWKPLPTPVINFPINKRHFLCMAAGSGNIKNALATWKKMNVPNWNLNSETFNTKLTEYANELIDLGLIDKKSGQITKAGSIALSLIDEGDSALFTGFAFSKFRSELKSEIKSPKDFLFVCSQILAKWRTKAQEGAATLSEKSIDCVGDGIRLVMKKIREDGKSPKDTILPIEQTTALYVLYPDVRKFPNLSESAIQSFMAHFTRKIEAFQRFARLPFGDEVIANLKKEFEW